MTGPLKMLQTMLALWQLSMPFLASTIVYGAGGIDVKVPIDLST
jgi:hypothetical protein